MEKWSSFENLKTTNHENSTDTSIDKIFSDIILFTLNRCKDRVQQNQVCMQQVMLAW